MSDELGFEQSWLHKLSTGLKEVAGEEIEKEVMQGAEALSSDSPTEGVIAWTSEAMVRLDALVEESDRRAILTGCACQYQQAPLAALRKTYEETENLALVHGMLQEQFETLLRDTLQLEEDLVQDVVGRAWGSAGVLDGSTVVATKIPKSGFLREYLGEQDATKRRQLYCHCPRVREILRSSVRISPTYCYCGAGFYKGIWEEILGEPVEVELLETVLQGDDVCRFAVHLPVGR
jgi:hypothetical protein